MEKLKKKKTGFTLVELLVVIAILAVLASVSVIGYLSFVKKAKVSNDSSLITQMNTTLQANEAVDGKNATAYDAIEELKDSGLDVNKLSPTTEGYHYAIDMSQNRAFLLDDSYQKVAPESLSISDNKEDVFVMVGSYDQISTINEKGYSVYLKNGFDWGTQASKEISTSKGVDVGENEVSKIIYAGREEVIIRTNSVETNIEQSSGTIHHYGQGRYAITSGSKWCEHGTLCEIQVSAGSVNIEDTAKVNGVKATGTGVESITCNNSDSLLYVTADSTANLIDVSKVHVAEGTLVASKESDITSSCIVYDPTADENGQYYFFSNSYDKITDDANPLKEFGIWWANVTLMKDLDIGGYSIGPDTYYSSYLFDLNGHKLSITGKNDNSTGTIYLFNNAVSTFKNGTIKFKSVGNSENQIEVGGGTHTFENVTIDASEGEDAFMFTGKGNLNLKNCKITAKGQCITTNANNSTKVANPNVTISNCEINSSGGFGIFNTNGIVFDIDNSTIQGTQGALLLRNGVTHIDDSVLISAEGPNNYTNGNKKDNWGSDGNVPAATLVVGNCGSSVDSYGSEITCIVNNSSITNTVDGGYRYALATPLGGSVTVTLIVNGESITETKQ